MSLEDETEAREQNTREIDREYNARNRLNGALDSLGGVIGGIVRGAPQNLEGIVRHIPAIGQGLASAMAGAEAYVHVWRDLTTRGVNFGNELDTMITRVGAANLQIDQFQRLVNESADSMAAIGGTANTGALNFLKLQNQFMDVNGEFTELRANLNRLGMDSQAISERFLEFDALANILGYRNRMDARERNVAAAEYAMKLDELARLTGKQIDQIAKENEEFATRGNIAAYLQTLPEEARDDFTAAMANVREMGPAVTKYVSDIFTRGFHDANDPVQRMINQAAGNLAGIIREADEAYRNGEIERGNELTRMAAEEAARLDENPLLARLARLSNATEESSAAMEIVGDVASSRFAQAQEAVEERARDMFGVADEARLTSFQLAQARRAILEEERRSQGAPTDTDGDGTPDVTAGEQLLNDYLAALRESGGLAAEVQDVAVATLFGTANEAVGTFRTEIEDLDLEGIFRNQASRVFGFAAAVAGASSPVNIARQASEATRAQLDTIAEAMSVTDEDRALEISEAAQRIGEMQAAYAADPNETTLAELTAAVQAGERIIESNRDIFVNGENVIIGGTPIEELGNLLRQILGMNPQSVGTMGTLGSLFGDFGDGMLATLHGMEAVVTPEQMSEIVRHSALGGMRAQAESLLSSGFMNPGSSLDGMLNTVRSLRTEVAESQSTNESPDLQRIMASFATQLKGPLEEAMNSTLVPRLEQLVSVSSEHLDTSDNIKRNLGNLSSNMLRRT